jgi:RNA 2',3'-cyclic 3'-phosphodiesterase
LDVVHLRTFLSYDLIEPSIISRISEFQNELKSTGADLKIVQPELLHFTIRFLGEIDESQRDRIIDALEGKVPPFSRVVSFQGVGTFPHVIWIRCDEESGKILAEQARQINSRLDSEVTGLRKETRGDFSPHLTIARLKSNRNKEKLQGFLELHRNDLFGSTKIERLRLKLSELSPSGPRYSDLHVFE